MRKNKINNLLELSSAVCKNDWVSIRRSAMQVKIMPCTNNFKVKNYSIYLKQKFCKIILGILQDNDHKNNYGKEKNFSHGLKK